ncbi:MAG: helix-turn-helix domain-containing protein [Pirellulales bacterium]
MAKSDETSAVAIGERLRWAREQAGLTQTQIARILKYHRPTVSQIEAGQRVVRPDEIARFASLYGVQEAWIIRGDTGIAPNQDARVEIAARELAKLRNEDLDTILKVIKVMRSSRGDGSE